jgi:hypothetical protein
MAGSAPNFNHGYIYLLRIFYGFFTRGEHNGPGHFIHYLFYGKMDTSTPLNSKAVENTALEP